MRKTDKIIISALALICINLSLLFYQNWVVNSKFDVVFYSINDLEHKIEKAETATKKLKR